VGTLKSIPSKQEQRNMSKSANLSLEQQFSIRSFEHQVRDMSREQAQEFLVNLYAQMMMQENSYKNLLKHQWGIDDSEHQAA
jgi:Phycobilisome degradation protein nblA